MKMLLPFVIFLAACGSGEKASNNNHGYGFAADVVGSAGLTLRYSGAVAADDPLADVAAYEKRFRELEECAGVTAPMPFVIVVPEGSLGRAPDTHREGNPLRDIAGAYLSDPPLILISSAGIFPHEAIHYLLAFSTGDPDGAHKSTMFVRCAGG